MKTRHIAMTTCLIVAAALAIWGDKTPNNTIVEATPRNASHSASTPLSALNVNHAPSNPTKKESSTSNNRPEPMILALLPRDEIPQASPKSAHLFVTQSWNPPSPKPAPAPPPPPPTAPTLPFTYIGKRMVDGAWEVFLGRGDNIVYIHATSVIDGTYRIDAIAPPVLKITYLPLNQQQTLAIGEPE